ncbi:MAG: hypothetical protein Q7K45_01525 [Nanoarchaeota archaeon]|nr:hypothetical protein [Nanoarchaeota archaeon]
MQEISNKTIVLLLAFALFITVASSVFTLQKINSLDQTFNVITGAPSFSFGETNITITSVTSLSLQTGGNGTAISFGSGYVNATCNACFMDSNGVSSNFFGNGSNTSQSNTAVCCTTFTVPASGFLLENTGNTNLSVGYTCTGNCTFANFLGGARSSGMGGLEIKVTANTMASQAGEDGGLDTIMSCLGGGTLFRDTGWNITNSSAYTSCSGTGGNIVTGNCTGTPGGIYTMLGTNHYLCGNSSNFPLRPDNTMDAGVVDINLTVLWDAPATSGRSSFRLTFNGSSS